MIQCIFLHHSMAYNTVEDHDFVCRLDRSGSVMRAFPHEDASLSDHVGFGIQSPQAHRVTQVLPSICCELRPGLAVGPCGR